MRTLFAAIALLVVIGAVSLWMGWISFGTTQQGDTEIIIHKRKIKDDVGDAIDKGKEALERNRPTTPPEALPESFN